MAVRTGVGLFDMTSFGKIRVEGRDAVERREADGRRARHVRLPRVRQDVIRAVLVHDDAHAHLVRGALDAEGDDAPPHTDEDVPF